MRLIWLLTHRTSTRQHLAFLNAVV
jgi:hypothetical protein